MFAAIRFKEIVKFDTLIEARRFALRMADTKSHLYTVAEIKDGKWSVVRREN